jgi:RNA binding exosome subunit
MSVRSQIVVVGVVVYDEEKKEKVQECLNNMLQLART